MQADDEAPTRGLEERVRALEAERDQLAGALSEARSALEEARTALRMREELFAVVVHELRNPLGTIVMGSTALLQGDAPEDPKLQRIRSVAERIQRQAERMTQQIANLSDFIELQAGRLVLELGNHTPSSILAAASELIAPIARERGVGFASEATELPAIPCDAGRVVQTLTSLATAAIRATARGGKVEIGARSDGAIYVRDHAEAANPRAETSLSYTMARGIVETHDGRIWIAHEAGTGNTIYFTLSPRN